MVWVDADHKIRYQRINGRARGEEDNKSFEQFLDEEQVEMDNHGDKYAVGMGKVKEIADIFLQNDSDDIETFNDEVEKVLNLS
jgi:cytidylate kinase